MSKCRYLDMGIVPIFVGFCGDEKSFKKEVKRLGIKGDFDFVEKDARVHYLTNDAATTCLVCFDKEQINSVSKNLVIALLAHEAVHVMQECKRVMGGRDHGSEFEAYTVQHVLQFLLYEVYGEE